MCNYWDTQTNWKFVKELGSGAFGEVSLWTNTETGESVAIKRCSKDIDKLAQDEQYKLKTRWLQESAWMKDINIENIVRACPDLCANLVAEQNQKVILPVIAMEYCDGGNLRSKLHQIENVNGFSEHDVRQVLGALKKAIFHLHDQYKITHRDIKPDNIVIKYDTEGKPIYKLTDMGYARIIDNDTIQGSMVGSRNYFAPEIVELAEYKNSVDYWSMGIVAFEIICGLYPFLPDGSMFETIMNIKRKPSGCIAITKLNNENICHHYQLFTENRLSGAFSKVIEPWLRLALDADGRKRGYEAPDDVQKRKPILTFYTKLDAALDTKVFTVFWLNRCKFLSYTVDERTTMDDLCSSMEEDTKISRNKFYFVLPAGHTLDHLTAETQPLQLYEETFELEDKPMLYLIDFKSDGLANPEDPSISEAILLTFNSNEKLHPRTLKQCLMNALFLHDIELKRVVECVNGIHEFAMNLESEIMKQEHRVHGFQENIVHLNGQATQFETMVIAGKKLLQEKKVTNTDSDDKEWDAITQNLKRLNDEYSIVYRRFKTNLIRVRDLMKNSPLSTYQEEVALHVRQFQSVFEEVRDKARFISPDEIRSYVCSLLRLRKDFFDNTSKWLRKNNGTEKRTSKPVDSIIEIHLEYHTIMKIVFENQSLCKEYGIKLSEKTKDFMLTFGEHFFNQGRNIESSVACIVEKIDRLDVDSEELTKCLVDDTDECVLELPTNGLIKDTKYLTEALSSLWNL